MITVFLRGGLGNQMFQYAAGLHLAKRNQASLALDVAYLNDRWPRKEFTYRTLDLDIFGIKPRFTLLSRVSNHFPVPGLWAALDFAGIQLREALILQTVVREREPNTFDPEVLKVGGSVLLFGYWQNEKYFKEIESDIREAFQFKIPLDDYAQKLKKEIESSESVALCVRRGDYVQHQSAKALMGDTNVDYYAKAIAHINERVKSPRYFVFTADDDIEFCKQTLNVPANTVYIGKLDPKWSFHLELMSLCRHSIIANSTFYWWGAWLNPHKNKTVIAPARWYADREKQPDIIPKSWITL